MYHPQRRQEEGQDAIESRVDDFGVVGLWPNALPKGHVLTMWVGVGVGVGFLVVVLVPGLVEVVEVLWGGQYVEVDVVFVLVLSVVFVNVEVGVGVLELVGDDVEEVLMDEVDEVVELGGILLLVVLLLVVGVADGVSEVLSLVGVVLVVLDISSVVDDSVVETKAVVLDSIEIVDVVETILE